MKILHLIDLSETISDLAKSSKNKIFIASPYVGGLKAVRHILGLNNTSKKKNARLLVDNSNPGNCDLATLNYLMDAGFKIKSLAMLHAKIYILDDKSIITSANLSERAFRFRKEIGILINKNLNEKIADIFEEYWNLGKPINKKFSEKKIQSQKKKYKNPGEKDFNNKVPPFHNFDYQSEIKGWLRISGYSKMPERGKPFNYKKSSKESFMGCKKFRNNGNPQLKENDLVILSRMGINNNEENDHYIWGRARVDIPYRDKRDDMLTYRKRIDTNLHKKEYEEIFKRMNKWNKGFWIKELEIIKGGKSELIWLSELKRKHKKLFGNISMENQSYIKLNKGQLNILNDELDKKLSKDNKKLDPKECWINEYIKDSSLKVTKDKIR